MGLSLKQRVEFHRKRSFDYDGERKDRFFSIGYLAGKNLFDERIWSDEQRRSVIKDKVSNVKKLSSNKSLSQAELEELSRSKGLISYASDLSQEKQKKGLSLFNKKVRK
jgi:hypothetical protein